METGNTIVKMLRARVHLPPANTMRAALLFLTLLALEAAPVQAWLIVYAAAQIGDARQTAAPFWLVAGILALFAVARWRLMRYSAIAVMGAWILLAGVSVLALARFSPLMFGGESLPLFSTSWLSALSNGETDYSGLAGLIPLTVYLGWRGSALGEPAPAFSRVSRRFSIGLGALTLAIFGSLATPPAFVGDVSAALLILLALEGFAGMSALALSRPLAGSGRTDTIMPGAEYSTRWQITAVIMAFVISASVALIGGALNVRALRTLFTWLGPVATLLNQAGAWLTQSLAYLLYLISVYWLSFLIPKNLPNQPPHTPQPPSGVKNTHVTPPIPAAYGNIAAIIIGAIAVIGVLILLFLLARVLLKSLSKSTDEEVEEEREDLDAGGLLRQQARNLLNRWRSARRRPSERDELRRGGARWLYREVLRAGARAGYERRESETADEYAARLATALDAGAARTGDSDASELRALTRAYDDARYGAAEHDPPASDAVAARTRQAVRRINTLAKEPAHRGR